MRSCLNGHPAEDADIYCAKCGAKAFETLPTPAVSQQNTDLPAAANNMQATEAPATSLPTANSLTSLVPGMYPHADGRFLYWDGSKWIDPGSSVATPPAQPTPIPHQLVTPAVRIQPYPAARPLSERAASVAPPPPSRTAGAISPTRVKAKSPGLAMFVSFLFPGVGSMMNGDVGIGVLILISYTLCILTFFLYVPLFIAPIIWVIGMVHAYSGAKNWNLRHGIIS